MDNKLIFLENISKNDQDGITFRCKFKHNNDAILTISDTALSGLGLQMYMMPIDLLRAINTLIIGNCPFIFEDNDKISNIDISSSSIRIVGDSSGQTIYNYGANLRQ